MPVDSVTSLVDSLQRFELLNSIQLDKLTRDPLTGASDPRTLAEGLVRRGWLTPFQIERVLQGRGQELVLGNYVLLDHLGQGGMGQVFQARHRRMGRIVALKVIAHGQLADPAAVRRFQREIEAAAQLEHPNVVRAYDADKAGDVHFFVMEYVEGMDLGKLVKRDGPLPIERACDYVRQAALGLQHAHERGLVHRDIKPANLLLAAHENVVKVLDLGLARLERLGEGTAGSPTLTRDGALMGTPDFIAPEQARDAHTADIRADLYSLGCTFYFLLTGRVPFPGGSLTEKLLKQQVDTPVPLGQLRPEVPSTVAAVVYRLMAKDPRDRYQTPAEAALALRSVAQGTTLNTSPGAERLAALSAVPDPFLSQSSQRKLSVPQQGDEPSANHSPSRRRKLALVVCGVFLLGCFSLLGWKMTTAVPGKDSPEQSAAELRQLGAIVTNASDDPDAPVVVVDCSGVAIRDADLAHLKNFSKLEKLYLYDTPVSDEGLVHLHGLLSLQLLGLGKTRISDAGLANLSDLVQLQVLWLGRTQITDVGLADLERLTRLRRLHLGGTRIGDAGLQHLQGLSELRELELRETSVSDAGLAHLRDLTWLQFLDLADTSVGDAGLAQLTRLTNLRHLNLAGSQVTDAGLKHLSLLHQLRTLDLTGTKVSVEGVRNLQESLATLKVQH